jgi:hypothetical protein
MDDDTSGADRQIDASEANRLAQELNRQVYADIPEFQPESISAGATKESPAIPGVERDPPDRELEERVWPPVGETPTEIGGGAAAIEALTEEERR